MTRRRTVNKPVSETGFVRATRNTFESYHNSTHKRDGLYWASVEDDHDPQKQGRVKVHIPQLSLSSGHAVGKRGPKGEGGNGNPGLIWCYPMMPSFGTTDSYGSEEGFANSYGFWGPQPRNGDIVVVAFVNGTMPVWIGCLPKPRKNFMVPGVPGAEVEGETYPVPATEKASTNINPRQVFTDLYQRITNAGLYNDRIRGIGTSGSTRESPSRVAGMLTPGSPKEGRPGHSFIMDDLPEQQGIRFRTSHGHQITFSDVSDTIYIASGQGNSWIELGDDGKIDVYSKDSLSIHTEADLNVRVDGDYLLDVAGDYYHKIGGDYKLEVGGNTDQIFNGYLKANIAKNYEISVNKNLKVAANKKIQVISTNDMSLASKARMLIYGSGVVGIDSGVNVKMENDIASLPSFSSITSNISSTLGAIGGNITDITNIANIGNISALASGVNPSVITNAISGMGGIATSFGIPASDLGGVVASFAANGFDPSSISTSITNMVETIGNIGNITEHLNIIENLGLNLSDIDISSHGLLSIMEKMNNAGLSLSDATTLFGSDIASSFNDITRQGVSISALNANMGSIDFSAFRDNASGLAASLTTSNINDVQATAMAASLSRFTGPRANTRNILNQFSHVLENPSDQALDIMARANIDPATVQLTDSNLLNVLSTLKERQLTVGVARQLFGREHGPFILNMINDTDNISSIITGFDNLDNSVMSNVISGDFGDFGETFADATGVVNNIDLGQFDLSGLNLSQVSDILNQTGMGDIPLSSLNIGDLRELIGNNVSNLNISNLRETLTTLGSGNELLGNLNSGDIGDTLNNISLGTLSNFGVNLDQIGVSGLESVLNNQLTGASSSGRIPTQSLPGPPSPGQAQAGATGSNQQYINRRVPQHEPWRPEGRIAPEAVATSESGNASASDGGVETATDRRAVPTGGTETGNAPSEGTELVPEDIEFLVVHCSASPSSSNYNTESIRRTHTVTNNWSRIGYHYIIERDGTIVNTLPETTKGIHVGAGGINNRSLAVCLIGGVDPDSTGRLRAAHNFTTAQLESLRGLLDELEGRYPSARLRGHRDFNNLYTNPANRKDCPSFNVQHWRLRDILIEPNAPAV